MLAHVITLKNFDLYSIAFNFIIHLTNVISWSVLEIINNFLMFLVQC